MKNNNKIIYSLDELDKVVDFLYLLLPKCSVFAFSGDLGAGKTTIIKKLLKRCGVKDIVISPTFTYVVEYANTQDQVFYHFDLYRITTIKEFIAAGFDEMLFQPNSWAFIEWPEVIMPLLNKNTCYINIDFYNEDKRIISFEIK